MNDPLLPFTEHQIGEFVFKKVVNQFHFTKSGFQIDFEDKSILRGDICEELDENKTILNAQLIAFYAGEEDLK